MRLINSKHHYSMIQIKYKRIVIRYYYHMVSSVEEGENVRIEYTKEEYDKL